MTTSEVTSQSGLPGTESLRAEIVETFDREYPQHAHLPVHEKLYRALSLQQEDALVTGDVATICSLYGEMHKEAVSAGELYQLHGKWYSTNDSCTARLRFLREVSKKQFTRNYRDAEKLRKDINFSRENFGILCLDLHNDLNHHQPHSIVGWRKQDGYMVGCTFNPKKANTWRFVFPQNVYDEIRKLGKKEARETLRAIKALDALA